MPDFRQPVGSSGLLVAAGLLGLVLGLHPVSVSAQWTNYYSCPTACAPAASNTCVYDCRVSEGMREERARPVEPAQ